jgi:hypothetical protein
VTILALIGSHPTAKKLGLRQCNASDWRENHPAKKIALKLEAGIKLRRRYSGTAIVAQKPLAVR